MNTPPDATITQLPTGGHDDKLHEAIDPLHSEQLKALEGMLSKKQLRSIVMSARHTMSFWVGAVSAGKTFASLIAFLIALLAVKRGERVMIVGRTLHTVGNNIMRPLTDPALFGPIATTIVWTPGASTAIILGRIVELVGAPTKLAVGNIQGSTLRLVYVDEATLIDREFFNMLETRLRVAGARLLATMNPASKNHYIRREYILNAKDHDLVTFYLTMRDNPSLARAYVARMIRAFSGLFFQRFILGLWTNAAGAIYDMFDPELHVIPYEKMPPIQRVLCVAIDYGASHATSAVMLGITNEYDDRMRWTPRLVLMDEWRFKADPEHGIARMAPSDMARDIVKWLNQDHTPNSEIVRPQFIFVDPSAAGFREELNRVRVRNMEADNDVEPGISDVSSLLAQGRLIITDRCTGVLEEITEYSWDAKKQAAGEDEPIKENDDSVDAMRYAIRSTKAIWFAAFKSAYDKAA